MKRSRSLQLIYLKVFNFIVVGGQASFLNKAVHAQSFANFGSFNYYLRIGVLVGLWGYMKERGFMLATLPWMLFSIFAKVV